MSTIAILSALHKESALLFDLPGDPPTTEFGFEVAQRTVGNTQVVAATSGMGTINAAAASQYLICRFAPDALILSGIAGSLNPRIGVGDVVVGCRLECLETNMAIVAEDYPHLSSFASNEHLLRLAQQELEARGFSAVPSVEQDCPAEKDLSFGLTGPHEPRFVMGAIATSDLFHETPAELEEVRRTSMVDCEEMEGAAAAQVCARAGVPFLAVRTISNPCGMTYGELDGRTNDLVATAQLATELALGVARRY